MAIGISPTVDYAFKKVFGNPEHPAITLLFLNSVLADQVHVAEVEFLNPLLGKDSDDDKLAVLDILARDQSGRTFNIEMQTTLPAGLSQRIAYYNARLYSDQLKEGDPYESLSPAISICVLTQPLFRQVADFHLDFRLRTESGLRLVNDIQIHFLELSKLHLPLHNIKSSSCLERWAVFLQQAAELTEQEITRFFPEREFTEAAGVLKMISKTPKEQMQYEARMKQQRDEAARIEFARREGRGEGREEGEAIGEARGREKGREEGEAKGRELGKIEALQQLLGVSSPSVAELQLFTPEQRSQLINELQQKLRDRGVAT